MTNFSQNAVGGLTRNVVRHILPNGLTVLIKANHTAPVAALLVSVKAGYFQEQDPVNGIAHVIEHMLFKGTPRRPADEQIAREVREIGGYINASTYYEETNYYITVPSLHLETALDIQADAFQNSLLDGEELAKEIEVIVQESLQKRDNPNAMLVESLYALAFDQHRIRRWRIGHPETLRGFRRDDLARFVQQTYRPENLVLAVVGDVDTEQTLELVRRFWGDMPRGELQREVSPVEPPRTEFRYQRMTGDTKQRMLLMSFPAPDILHPDAAALLVLNALLSDGRSARLYQRLKEELKLANSAWASYEGFEQMGLFMLGAECVNDDPLPVERALLAEIAHLQREPIPTEDLERIKTRIESRRLFGQEEVMGVARTLASYQHLGDYYLADELAARLRGVTPDDVQRVANTYVQLETATLLEYLPADSNAPTPLSTEDMFDALRATEPDLPMNELQPEAVGQSPTVFARSVDAEPRSIPLPGGGTLLYKLRRDLPIIALNALFRGGKKQETPSIAGITNLMLKSSLKGTRGRNGRSGLSAQEIANRVESLGTNIGLSAGMEYLGYGFKVKQDVLPDVFAIFSDVLNRPVFAPEEVDREKQAIFADIRRQQDNNFSLANDLFSAACYGETHPYGLPANGITEALEALTPEGLRAWHTSHVTPENLIVGIVGAIAEQEAVALIGNLLEERRERGEDGKAERLFHPSSVSAVSSLASFPASIVEKAIYRQKQQTASVMGFAGADMFNDDRYALDILNEITSGMGGRLFRAVRGENALAYQVTSFHRSRLDAGNFITYTSTAPENEERARGLILAEIARLHAEPVSQEELKTAKASILGEHVINMQTFAAQAGELSVIGVYGLPLDEPQRYLRRIQDVTVEQIQDVARRYLHIHQYWLGVVRGGANGN